MSTLTLRERPTLADLHAFAAEMDRLQTEIRRLRMLADACRQAAEASLVKRDGLVERYVQTADPRKLRDTAVFKIAPRAKKKAAAQLAEANELEQQASAIWIERLKLERTHQMEAHDYREYLSEGLPLPAHRAELYASAERRAA